MSAAYFFGILENLLVFQLGLTPGDRLVMLFVLTIVCVNVVTLSIFIIFHPILN